MTQDQSAAAKTDEAGRFNFPQLKPGAYAVRIEAQGFEPAHPLKTTGLLTRGGYPPT